MAVDSLREFTIQWVVGGFLMICMLAFTISFMYSNNPTGLGTDSSSIFLDSYNSTYNLLDESGEDANVLLNITSNTNPEVSDMGSRDVVASSFEAKASAKKYWDSSRKLISWIFSGTTGKILLTVIGGLIGLMSFFLISKAIRTGD